MNKSEQFPKNLMEQACLLMNKNSDNEYLETKLLNAGYDIDLVKSAIKALKKEKHDKDLHKGLVLIGSGVLVMVLSFFITLYFFHTNVPLDIFMYTSTCLGIIICLLGFKKLVG
jgi:hypothetical protein